MKSKQKKTRNENCSFDEKERIDFDCFLFLVIIYGHSFHRNQQNIHIGKNPTFIFCVKRFLKLKTQYLLGLKPILPKGSRIIEEIRDSYI